MNALCNLSRKKSQGVAASLPGRFLSRRCLLEAEPWIAKQYKCHHCCITGKSGWRVGGKVSASFWGTDQNIATSWEKNAFFGHPITRATRYCLLPDTFWLQASKNAFKVGSVKFANSLSSPSIVKKVRTGSKSSQGTWRCRAKVKGVNNPTWTTQYTQSASPSYGIDISGSSEMTSRRHNDNWRRRTVEESSHEDGSSLRNVAMSTSMLLFAGCVDNCLRKSFL